MKRLLAILLVLAIGLILLLGRIGKPDCEALGYTGHAIVSGEVFCTDGKGNLIPVVEAASPLWRERNKGDTDGPE